MRARACVCVSPASVGIEFVSGNLPLGNSVIVMHGTEPTELLSASAEQDTT